AATVSAPHGSVHLVSTASYTGRNTTVVEWSRPVGRRGELLITTPVSLLHRLRQGAAPLDWQRFVQLYTPLLFRLARGAGAQDADAADLVQEVLTLLWRKLPTFDYDGSRSFRGWLRTVLLNKWRDVCRHRAARPDQPDGRTLETAPASDEDWEEREDRQ